MVYSAIAFLLVWVTILQLSSLPEWIVELALLLLLVMAIRWRFFWLAASKVAILWSVVHTVFNLNDTSPHTLIVEDITVSGQIVGLPQQQDQMLRFLLKPDKAEPTLPKNPHELVLPTKSPT